jgi:outer membrane receptor protein involved in Fe transport
MPADVPPPQAAIVIVAARLPDAERESVYSRAELSAEDIHAAMRIDDALRQVPAASLFRRTNSSVANASTQGLSFRAIAPSGAGRALVTLDGAPLNDPFGNWVIWSQVPTETLERIEIVRGAGAGAYGAGALTGIAQLYEATRADRPLAFDAGVGENNAHRLSLRAYPEFASGRLALSIAGEEQNGFIPVRSSQRGAVDERAEYGAASAAARWAGQIHGVDTAVRLGAYEETRGGGVVGVDSASRGGVFSLSLAEPNGESEGWRASLWVHRSDFENSSVSIAPGRATATPANDQYATPALGYGGQAAWRTLLNDVQLEFGGDARFYEGETREKYSSGLTARRVAGGEAGVSGLYTEASVRDGDWLFTGGVRADYWFTQDAIRRQTLPALSIGAPDRDGVLASWRLGAVRDLDADLKLRVAAYSGFRPPSLNELHRPFRVGNDVTEANPSLDPERLLGAELGLNGAGGRWAWSGTVFYNRLEDAIANVTVATSGSVVLPGYGGALTSTVPGGGVLRQRRNLDAIDAIGFEGDVTYALSDAVSVRGALSATDARVEGGSSVPDLTNKRPAQAPVWSLTAGADWSVTPVWSMRADWRWESARWEDDLNTRRLAPGGQLNLQSAWRVSDDLTLRLRVENLLDSEIETAEALDGVESLAAPRQVWLEISVR